MLSPAESLWAYRPLDMSRHVLDPQNCLLMCSWEKYLEISTVHAHMCISRWNSHWQLCRGKKSHMQFAFNGYCHQQQTIIHRSLYVHVTINYLGASDNLCTLVWLTGPKGYKTKGPVLTVPTVVPLRPWGVHASGRTVGPKVSLNNYCIIKIFAPAST